MVAQLLNSLEKLEEDPAKKQKNIPYVQAIEMIAREFPRYFLAPDPNRRFSEWRVGPVLSRELKSFLQQFRIVLHNDNSIIVQGESPESVVDRLSGKYKIVYRDTFSRLIVHNPDSFAGLSVNSSEIVRHNFSIDRWDWCPATARIANGVFTLVMKSNDTVSDVIPYLHKQSIEKLPVRDFAVPLDNVVHCLGGVLKKVSEIESVGEIDINWYKLKQMVPAVWRIVGPMEQVTEQQVCEGFGVPGRVDGLVYECPNCGQQCLCGGIGPDCFDCRGCQARFGWKALANLLTLGIRRLVAERATQKCQCKAVMCFFEWEQVCVAGQSMEHGDWKNPGLRCRGKGHLKRNDLYAMLRGFQEMFLAEIGGGEDVCKMAQYMVDVVQDVLAVHGHHNVRLTSVMANQSLAHDDGACFSFLD
jgi:hypothetical protein